MMQVLDPYSGWNCPEQETCNYYNAFRTDPCAKCGKNRTVYFFCCYCQGYQECSYLYKKDGSDIYCWKNPFHVRCKQCLWKGTVDKLFEIPVVVISSEIKDGKKETSSARSSRSSNKPKKRKIVQDLEELADVENSTNSKIFLVDSLNSLLP